MKYSRPLLTFVQNDGELIESTLLMRNLQRGTSMRIPCALITATLCLILYPMPTNAQEYYSAFSTCETPAYTWYPSAAANYETRYVGSAPTTYAATRSAGNHYGTTGWYSVPSVSHCDPCSTVTSRPARTTFRRVCKRTCSGTVVCKTVMETPATAEYSYPSSNTSGSSRSYKVIVYDNATKDYRELWIHVDVQTNQVTKVIPGKYVVPGENVVPVTPSTSRLYPTRLVRRSFH